MSNKSLLAISISSRAMQLLPISPVYRIFHIADDGHINKSDVLEAPDDVQAVILARSLVKRQPVEVWERARRIARLEPQK